MINEKENYSFLSKKDNRIWVRRIQPGDAPLLVNVFEHMTPESRYRRFHQTLDTVSHQRVWQEAQNIAQADPEHNLGFLALADRADKGLVPIGAVRIVELTPEEAEVAISIRDDFQNEGIGTHLMHLIADEAKLLGYRRLVADIMNDNAAIFKVFTKLPYNVQHLPQGSYSKIIIALT